MQLNDLKRAASRKKHRRVGRGGKKGTYSGKGIKGQNARAGRKKQPMIRELIKRYPKLRGYKFKSFGTGHATVRLEVLEKKFKPEEIISPQSLFEKKIIRRIKGKIPKVKILSGKEIKTPLIFQDCLFSKKARQEVEKAGGKIQ